MANKEIIILEVAATDVGDTQVRFVLWFYIPAANQVPKPGVRSLWRDASTQDNTNLQTGAVVEESRTIVFPLGMEVDAMKAYLVNVYNVRSTAISALPNPNTFYGSFYDGTWNGV